MANLLHRIKRDRFEHRLQSVVKKSGWSYEKAFIEMARARDELGITYADYARNDFYELTEEEQQEEAEKILQSKKEWNKAVDFIVDETGYDRESVIEELEQVREEYFITAKQFVDKRLYEASGEDFEKLCGKLRAGNAKAARRGYIRDAIRASKLGKRPDAAETEERDISSLKYADGGREKQPEPVIAACYYLGIPLPEDAGGEYQPSAFVPELRGGLKTIRKIIGRKKVPDTEYIKREYRLFKRKFKSMNTLHYNGTDLIIFFTDYVMHCMDQGYRGNDYFNYGFYQNDPDVRCTFISTGRYKRYVRSLCIKDLDLFKSKSNFNEQFSDYIQRDWLDMTKADIDGFRAFTGRHKVFFAKPVLGTGGKGAGKIDSRGRDIEELYEECVREGYIIEDIVRQHEKMAAFNPGTLNTVRVYALTDIDNNTHITGAFARFGRTGSDVDNFHSGGMGAAVDPKSGTIYTDAIDIKGDSFGEHPDSHIRFKGFVVPEWEKLKEAVSGACLSCADINRHVGWDIAITDKGEIEFIEGNATPNFDFLQAVDKKGKFEIYDRYLTPIAEAAGKKPVRPVHPKLDVSHMQTAGNKGNK